MNIVSTLTKKHMLKNKKRTVVTILGIIISVAMFTAVTTFASSFMKMLQNDYNKMNGDWHVCYQGVDEDDISNLKQDSNTDTLISMYFVDIMYFDMNKEYNPDFNINALDQENFRKSVTLSEGEYPKNDNEIILDKYFLNAYNMQVELGDTIPLLTGTQSKEYTVVGYIDSYHLQTMKEGGMALTYATSQVISNSPFAYAYVTLNSVTNNIYDNSKETAENMGLSESDVFYNRNLIYYGVSSNNTFLTALYTIIVIIMIVIMVGSIMLIYNAFAISLSERSKNLGMLSSIGATKNQKRNSVFYEGVVLGLISIPLGILVGIGGLGITFACINPIIKDVSGSAGFPLTISIPGMLLAISFAIITIIISTYIPARRASKISPIEAMRSSHDIKISKRTVKTSKLTNKLFGFEGELALKNLKRNKKRYYVTIISLIVSVILFLSVSGFTYYFKNAFVMSSQSMNYDAEIYSYDDLGKDVFQKLSTIKNADAFAASKKSMYNCKVPINRIDSKLISLLNEMDYGIDDYLYITLDIYTYDKAYLDTYYKEQNITPGSVIINKSNVIAAKRKYTESTVFKNQNENMKFTIEVYNEDSNEVKDMDIEFKNVVYTNELPLGATQPSSPDWIEVIVPEDIFEDLLFDTQPSQNLYYKTSNNDAFDAEMQDILSQNKDKDIYYYNIASQMETVNQVLFVVNVFVYGFIILISLISIANIFNTITTSVSLRTKEFAMLKSIGMTPKAFNKMIYFESIFYGLHTLIFSIPISIAIMYLIHNSLVSVFNNVFSIPIINIVIAIVAVFLIVGATLLFSTSKIRKQNIIDGLRTENI